MKKPVNNYAADYPINKELKQYYGNCESCNSCNDGHSSCIVINNKEK